MEIGPYRVKDGVNGPVLEENPGSWDEFANIMFVDNPVGTGYSFVDTDSYLHELPEMAEQFIKFLDKWFALFPEYEHDDVSLFSQVRCLLLTLTALPCWRILCWPAHSIHCESDS
jgi:carboxypeptidase D